MIKIHTILFVFLSTLFVSSQAKHFISESYAQEAVADDMVRNSIFRENDLLTFLEHSNLESELRTRLHASRSPLLCCLGQNLP